MDIKALAKSALDARKNAYCPYSGFAVGAALITKSGVIYTGCNIENAAFSPTNCAERTAFFKAISEGETEFSAIAICAGAKEQAPTDFCPPCGVCRQVMAEFCTSDFKVILVKSEMEIQIHTLNEVLPLSFNKENL